MRVIVQEVALKKSEGHHFRHFISELPTIDAAEIVNAKWETHYFSDRFDTFGNPDFCMKCSACGFLWARLIDTQHFFRYCPNCGAKMDERSGETDV